MMVKSIRCSDVGMVCSWCAVARTEGELMVMIENHVKAHGYFEIPDDLLLKVRSVIREEPVECQDIIN